MKGLKNFILWTIVILGSVLIFGGIFLVGGPPFEVSERDKFAYLLQVTVFLLPMIVGALLHLDIFHVRKKVPLLNKNKIWATLVYWAVMGIIIPTLLAAFVNPLFSDDYRIRYQEYKTEMENFDPNAKKPADTGIPK